MPNFSHDWFSHNIPNFNGVKQFMGDPPKRILEIGSNEGRSTCWMLENMLADDGEITCIDPFVHSPLSAFDFDANNEDRALETRFRTNVNSVKKAGQSITVMPDLSFYALAELIVQKQQYDFIYVDGSHTAEESLADIIMAFGLLKKGGVMILDDYLWDHPTEHLDRPKMSIDSFINMFIRKINILAQNYQVIIGKK
jgi:predicted O-methyltransferase YrrM